MKILIACEESQAVCKEFRKRGHEAFSCDVQPCTGGHPEWHIQGDVLEIMKGVPRKVIHAADCHYESWDDDREMPVCPECNIEYANCPCPRPTQDDVYFIEIDGELYGITEDAEPWYMMIAFPPCTHLAVSGAKHFEEKRKDGRQQEGIDFFMDMINAPIERICVENPVGIMSSLYRKPDQIIQPYYFGDEAQKTTCLWLKNLPPLFHTDKVDLFNDEVTHVGRGEFVTTSGGKTLPKWYSNSRGSGNGMRGGNRSKTFPGIAKAIAEQWG